MELWMSFKIRKSQNWFFIGLLLTISYSNLWAAEKKQTLMRSPSQEEETSTHTLFNALLFSRSKTVTLESPALHLTEIYQVLPMEPSVVAHIGFDQKRVVLFIGPYADQGGINWWSKMDYEPEAGKTLEPFEFLIAATHDRVVQITIKPGATVYSSPRRPGMESLLDKILFNQTIRFENANIEVTDWGPNSVLAFKRQLVP